MKDVWQTHRVTASRVPLFSPVFVLKVCLDYIFHYKAPKYAAIHVLYNFVMI